MTRPDKLGWKVLLAVGGVLLLTAVIAGVTSIGGLLVAYRAVGSPSVDPSMKAQVLAEGISHSMNATAFSLVTGTIAFSLIGVALFGLLRRPRIQREPH